MKKFLLSILICCAFVAKGQVYNNEWIDFSKTYYKFKVGKTGLYRINQSTLATVGLGSSPAQDFQLWRNGVQVPIYTSVASGSLSASDYIEFWGEMNDGKPDKELYRKPEYQLNDKWSLETDTAMYFLTVNPGGSNFRLTNTANNVSTNTLGPEPYFMHTVGKYFREQFSSGKATNADGVNFYSSAYEYEGFTSSEISNSTRTYTFNDLQVNGSGPSAKFNIAVSGNSAVNRGFIVRINGDSIYGGNPNYFDYLSGSSNIPLSLLSTNVANVDVQCIGERMVIHKYEITYPRNFNFGGAENFEFELPANANGNYLEISNFSFGSSIPVLYDITNGQRYIADLAVPSLIRFALQPSIINRKLVLVSEEPANINLITNFQQRAFNNYFAASNQGNYIIITNSILFNGPNGINPVEEYRAYRNSVPGGGFNAKIYLEDELIDQFGFGIRKNPAGLRNFIRFARHKFISKPEHVFLVGKGVDYVTQRFYDNDPNVNSLNLVPAMGIPVSDNLLAAEPGSSIPEVPIGRLSVVFPQEIIDYLDKVKENEQAQLDNSPKFEDRAWTKTVIHLNGASDPVLNAQITSAFGQFKNIISDSLYGANVVTFTKQSSAALEPVSSNFKQTFENGVSIITYFGHSSSGILSYTLDEPSEYLNRGKYPSFIALGCSAGSIFGASGSRFTKLEGISEKYVLSPKSGMINFLASTHFGIVYYLKFWNEYFYKNLATKSYGKSIGEAIKQTAIDVFNISSQEDHYLRSHVEELLLHGDPAIRPNPHAKADYVLTDQMVKITPEYISINKKTFKVNAEIYNIGKAVSNNISIEIKQQFPDQTTKTVFKDTIEGIRYKYLLDVDLPIDAIKDKGSNKIIITIDADNNVDEQYESNNSVTKEFIIFEDEAQPIYPYNFAIVNKSTVKLAFSTANPLSEEKNYKVEMDTTEFFNSSLKISKTINSKGGLIEIDPGITLTENTVYYWRVAIVPSSGEYKWNTSSFVYLKNSEPGFNQSHFFQHLKSAGEGIYLDSTSRTWKNDLAVPTQISAAIATFPHALETEFAVSVNGNPSITLACWFSSLIFNVFDSSTIVPWINQTIRPSSGGSDVGEGLYNSAQNNCFAGRQNNFEFRYADTSSRRKMMDFMRDVIPDGSYVIVRSMTLEDYWGFPKAYASDWAADTSIHGSGQSLYHYLKNAGFAELDSFNRVRQWVFVYRKNDPSFTPRWVFTSDPYDKQRLSFEVTGRVASGSITSPVFGPSKKWKQLLWNGASLEAVTGDDPRIDIIGIKKDNTQTVLFNNIGLDQKELDLSTIDAKIYPNLQLRMNNRDTTKYTPYQLQFWRLTGEPAPEGALAPNIFIKKQDTLEAGQPFDFRILFKNVSEWAFDSLLQVRMVIRDQNNVEHVLPILKHRSLPGFDTVYIRNMMDTAINTKNFLGLNRLYLEVNPVEDGQPEQYHFNNFLYTDFYVVNDTLSPLLDVTFDNVHILNNDLISSRPEIVIKLKDESKWLLLNDTSLITVKVRYPNGSIRAFNFNNDTLRFIQAKTSSDNTATINFKPYFTEDGLYELIISAKDESDNSAGKLDYKIGFQVINKPMISNMLNYPNPFTTSTAFVFTITGSEVPQNIKIQILTITGKVVREITKEELGPLHIGRNITEFKWDGTDQYGQKLGNGVYLYRVVTNLNGKSLDKYTSKQDDTDKYFNKGYGKMYLMR